MPSTTLSHPNLKLHNHHYILNQDTSIKCPPTTNNKKLPPTLDLQLTPPQHMIMWCWWFFYCCWWHVNSRVVGDWYYALELLVAIRNQPTRRDDDNKDDFTSSSPTVLHFAAFTPRLLWSVGRWWVVVGDFCACHIHRHCSTLITSPLHVLPLPLLLVLFSYIQHSLPSRWPSSCRVGYSRELNSEELNKWLFFVAHFHPRPPSFPRPRAHAAESPFPTPLSHFITCTLIRPHSAAAGRVRKVGSLGLFGSLLLRALCSLYLSTHALDVDFHRHSWWGWRFTHIVIEYTRNWWSGGGWAGGWCDVIECSDRGGWNIWMTLLVNDDGRLVRNLWFMLVRGLGYLKGAREEYFNLMVMKWILGYCRRLFWERISMGG